MILLLVEFDDKGRPFAAYAQDAPERGLHIYDIDWCERDQCYYSHMSGGGAIEPWAERRYWAAQSVQEVRHSEGRVPKRLKQMPRPHSISSIVHQLESDETRTIYCSICEDHLPDSCPCSHIEWCDECSIWATPDEPCEHVKEAADDGR